MWKTGSTIPVVLKKSRRHFNKKGKKMYERTVCERLFYFKPPPHPAHSRPADDHRLLFHPAVVFPDAGGDRDRLDDEHDHDRPAGQRLARLVRLSGFPQAVRTRKIHPRPIWSQRVWHAGRTWIVSNLAFGRRPKPNRVRGSLCAFRVADKRSHSRLVSVVLQRRRQSRLHIGARLRVRAQADPAGQSRFRPGSSRCSCSSRLA